MTIQINFPASEKIIRKLKVGDRVSLYGTVVTARDAAHKFMVEKWPDFISPFLKNGAIYHCGPVMQKNKEEWRAISAGPTTSIREEIYEPAVIDHYNVRAIIGKGGMGEKTSDALKKFGAVYIHVAGGAAALIANRIIKTKNVFMLGEFGVPEAFWIYEVEDLNGVVTMDSKGNSLHSDIFESSKIERNRLLLL